ncbi:MAG: 2-isopropylmalate synthase [Chitinivibrionales bacterium]|nr:2-isopropylmalate synthase [Chitinivibrionales bacterium]
MHDKVIIFDTTLRDGEQSLTASLSMEQKLRIARQLALLRVDVIEAGFPASSPGDFQSVQSIAQQVSGPVICALCRAVEKDITQAAQALQSAQHKRIHTFIGTSALHMEKKLHKRPDEILAMISHHVTFARNLAEDVQFSAEDAARSDPDFLCRVVECAIRAGAATINIPDTVGYSTPEQFGGLISTLFNKVPIIDKAVIAVHCHDDLGMASANSLTAVSAGARQVECTINGIGERAGNAALEEVVMALRLHRKSLKVLCGVETRQIMRSSRMVRDICAIPVQPNKAIVGSNAFSHSSGIHQDGILKEKKTYEILSPHQIGLKQNTLNLTARSGRHMIRSQLRNLGYEDSEYDLNDLYEKFIHLADKKGTIYEDDLIVLMEAKTDSDIKDTYRLDYLQVTTGRGTVPTACVRLQANEKMLQHASCGDGAVDATYKAIEKAVNMQMRIMDYQLDSVSQGSEALGKVTLHAKACGTLFVGIGISTDIVEASALAYIDALNKAVRIKKLRQAEKVDLKTE